MSCPPIEDGAIWVEAGTIRATGKLSDVRRDGRGELIDVGDAVLLPGLINAHCHLELTDTAGKSSFQGSFTGWLKQIVALKRDWQQAEYEQSAMRGAKMLLQSGTTSVCDVVSWW